MSSLAGFNLFGYLSSRLGLGEAAGNTARLMRSSGYQFVAADIRPPVEVVHEPLDSTWAMASSSRDLAFPVNVFHMNPPELVAMLARRGVPKLRLKDRLNAIVLFWELPVLPPSWATAIGGLDAVLAPTHYIAEATHRAAPGVPVIHFPQAVYQPDSVIPDRHRWGIRDGTTAFLCMFDVLSDIERKNPWGAVNAFMEAFGSRTDVQLLIKVNNSRASGLQSAEHRRLRALASDQRFVLIDESLSRADLWSLYASVDVFVSLHRAEGLGLGLLEAMSIGKPVVATGWSGNMDFMTEANSFPVSYDLVPVTQASGYARFAHGLQWAEPHQGEAARVMMRLADDAALRAEIGERAREAARVVRMRHQAATALEQLLEMNETGIIRGWRRLAPLWRSVAFMSAKRGAVLAMRTARLKQQPHQRELPDELALHLIDAAMREQLVRGGIDPDPDC